MTADRLFIVSVLTVNVMVWAVLSIPKYRRKLPKIYLIARSWLLMLVTLFVSFWIASYELPKTVSGIEAGLQVETVRPYEWVLPVLFVIIGIRGAFEIARICNGKTKLYLIQKLITKKVQGASPLAKGISHPPLSISNAPATTNTSTSKTGQNESIETGLNIAIALGLFGLIISLITLSHLAIERGQHGVFLFVIFASQFNDIAQFLCGKLLGGKLTKRKLAPTISPNKTIEGAFFGSLLSASLATTLGLGLTPFNASHCFMMAYFLAVTGIMGDLLESAFKRKHGIKDTGTMLAGHGGILDRVDSLLIGVPLYTLYYWALI